MSLEPDYEHQVDVMKINRFMDDTMETINKSVLKKTAVLLLCSCSPFVQASDTKWPATDEIKAAIAPEEINLTAAKKSKLIIKQNKMDFLPQENAITQLTVDDGTLFFPQPAAEIKNKIIISPITTTALKPRNNRMATLAVSDIIETPPITPLCPTLSTDIGYTINSTEVGQAYCYHFKIEQKSKTTALVFDIALDNNMKLTLLRHEADDSLTTLAISDNLENNSESILALTEVGDYYWYIEALTSDGSPIQFGALTNTAIDEYEMNDSVSLSTVLPDKLINLNASMDSATDVDYYNFTSRGQDLTFQFSAQDGGSIDEWIFDFHDGSTWVTLNGANYALTLPAGSVLHFRVSANPASVVTPNHNYKLHIGSVLRKMLSFSVNDESGVFRIPRSASGNTLTTQFYEKFYWSVKLGDSMGGPVEGELVEFRYIMEGDGDTVTVDAVKTNVAGYASGTVDLGRCSGGTESGYHYSYEGNVKTKWKSWFKLGLWRIDIPNAREEDELGVGGDNVAGVTLGHICSQKVQRQ